MLNYLRVAIPTRRAANKTGILSAQSPSWSPRLSIAPRVASSGLPSSHHLRNHDGQELFTRYNYNLINGCMNLLVFLLINMCSKRNYKGFYRTPRNCNGPTKIVNERVDLHDVLVEKRKENWGGCECVCVCVCVCDTTNNRIYIYIYIYIYAKKHIDSSQERRE